MRGVCSACVATRQLLCTLQVAELPVPVVFPPCLPLLPEVMLPHQQVCCLLHGPYVQGSLLAVSHVVLVLTPATAEPALMRHSSAVASYF
jgi:hypothetical protein